MARAGQRPGSGGGPGGGRERDVRGSVRHGQLPHRLSGQADGHRLCGERGRVRRHLRGRCARLRLGRLGLAGAGAARSAGRGGHDARAGRRVRRCARRHPDLTRRGDQAHLFPRPDLVPVWADQGLGGVVSGEPTVNAALNTAGASRRNTAVGCGHERQRAFGGAAVFFLGWLPVKHWQTASAIIGGIHEEALLAVAKRSHVDVDGPRRD
mmetsp:Transcript_19969/g.64846  ORF Transcript_19969/g.64846 Transcript_19969/m.64846 type:complete len:210 (-) Transcript_19969:157-786(-)